MRSILFTNVLKKFLPGRLIFENKEATRIRKAPPMLTDLKDIFARSSATLLQDLAGAAALVLMLFVGLNLPML